MRSESLRGLRAASAGRTGQMPQTHLPKDSYLSQARAGQGLGPASLSVPVSWKPVCSAPGSICGQGVGCKAPFREMSPVLRANLPSGDFPCLSALPSRVTQDSWFPFAWSTGLRCNRTVLWVCSPFLNTYSDRRRPTSLGRPGTEGQADPPWPRGASQTGSQLSTCQEEAGSSNEVTVTLLSPPLWPHPWHQALLSL